VKNVFFYRFAALGSVEGLGEIVIGIAETDGAVTELFFENHVPAGFRRVESRKEETPLIREAAAQVESYLSGKLREFSVPIAMSGTDFQKDVWNALLTIPYGETASYGEIASLIGRPKAARAVGLANNRNPISVIVPCHRVIGGDGKLVGYGGGLPLKRYLLDLERGTNRPV